MSIQYVIETLLSLLDSLKNASEYSNVLNGLIFAVVTFLLTTILGFIFRNKKDNEKVERQVANIHIEVGVGTHKLTTLLDLLAATYGVPNLKGVQLEAEELLEDMGDKPESQYSPLLKPSIDAILKSKELQERLCDPLNSFIEKEVDANFVVRASRVQKRLGEGFFLDVCDFNIRAGSIVALTGPNGSGKSTLLKILAGELGCNTAETGEELSYSFDEGFEKDCSWEQRKTEISYVAQTPTPFWYTVEKELQVCAAFKGYRGDELDDYVRQLLYTYNIVKLKDKEWDELSGGEQTRVSLAKALCGNPELVLLDEPLAALDPNALANFLLRLRHYIKRTPKSAIVFSSQHIHECESVADSVIYVSQGEVITMSREENSCLFEISMSSNSSLSYESIENVTQGNSDISVSRYGLKIIIKTVLGYKMSDILNLLENSDEVKAIRDISQSIIRCFIDE